MQSGSDSSDPRYDSSDSRDDSRYDFADPRLRNRARRTIVLTHVGLSLNMFVLLGTVWAFAYAGLASMLLLPVFALLAITGLTVNVLAFVFGRLAARSEMPADGKAACRVCVVVALLQVLTVLALTFIALERLGGQFFGPKPVTKPTTPATMPVVSTTKRPAESPPTIRNPGE